MRIRLSELFHQNTENAVKNNKQGRYQTMVPANPLAAPQQVQNRKHNQPFKKGLVQLRRMPRQIPAGREPYRPGNISYPSP